MRRTLVAAVLVGCTGKNNDLDITPGCPPQFEDPDPVISDGIRRRLNTLDLPPEERPVYSWPNGTAFKWPGDDPPLWDTWFNINTTAWSDWLPINKTFEINTKSALPAITDYIKDDFAVLRKAGFTLPMSTNPTACRYRTRNIAGTHYDALYNIEEITWRVKLFKPMRGKHPTTVHAFDAFPYWELDGRWERDYSFDVDMPDELLHINKWSLGPCPNCVPPNEWPEHRPLADFT